MEKLPKDSLVPNSLSAQSTPKLNHEPLDPIAQKLIQEGLVLQQPSQADPKEIKKEVAVLSSGLSLNESSESSHVGKVQEVVTIHLQPVSTVEPTPVPTPTEAIVDPIRPRIDRSHLQQSTFATLTRNIPNCQQMLEAHGRDAAVNQLVSALQQGDNWDQIIEHYGQLESGILALDALKAFRDNKISIEQFCTLSYCDALFREFPGSEIRTRPLFDADGTIDPVAHRVIVQGLYREGLKNIFTPEEARRIEGEFFENMRHQLPSEQFFFYIPFSRSRREDETIGAAVRQRIGLGITLCGLDGGVCRMIPSFSMMQAVVDAYGQENTVALCPTIGASTRADFRRNAAQGGREIFNPFPGYPFPNIADGLPVENFLDFILHDLYHCLTCSQVPEQFRQETGRIADMIARLQEQSADDQDEMTIPFLETLYGRMVDMEFSFFRKGYRDTLPKLNGFDKKEIYLATLQQMLFDETPKRIRLKLTTLVPIEQRGVEQEGISASAQESLRKWDRLQESIAHKMIPKVDVKKSNEQDVWYKTLYEMFDHSIERHLVIQFAEELYKGGFLKRLNISQESLEKVQSLSSRLIGTSPEVLLSHRLQTLQSQNA